MAEESGRQGRMEANMKSPVPFNMKPSHPLSAMYASEWFKKEMNAIQERMFSGYPGIREYMKRAGTIKPKEPCQ